MDFYIVDVFIESKKGGSQLGVFISSMWPSEKNMLAIAGELGFPEVSFLRKTTQADTFEMRIFTINYELPFAGHPTVGTAWVTRKIFGARNNKLTLECKLGSIPIEFSDSTDEAIITMSLQQPVFDNEFSIKEIQSFTNLQEKDFDVKMPLQSVANGAKFIIIPLLSEQALGKVRVDYESWIAFLKLNKIHMSTSASGQTTSLYFYVRLDDQKNEYQVRMFTDEHKMAREDAATGSAAGCLLAYLLKYKKIQTLLQTTIRQGQEVGRPSKLYIEGNYDGQTFNLRIGGKVKCVAKGEWSTDV